MDFHRHRKIEANIDMTPMIDTLLQLFLIFLLSASFVASTVRLDLPQATARHKASVEPIVVALDASNRLFLNHQPVTLAELPARLPALLRKRAKHDVIFRAHLKLPYQDILKTLVALEQAGAKTVHLAYNNEPNK